MQMNRLFEMVYILMNKKTVTAKELAEHFEVSMRTIYRDVETLSGAGIPIYTNKGKGGGISLLEDFVLNKSILSEQEQNEILTSLQSLNAVKMPDIEPVLNKLSVIFNKEGMNWIDVDFSRWGCDAIEHEKFNILKTAILNRTMVNFKYYSSSGGETERTVEPVRLIFKGQGWYLYAFCKKRNDFRFFKITRMKNLGASIEVFQREAPNNIWEQKKAPKYKMVTVILNIEAKMAFRIYDEFDETCILKNKDGSYKVTAILPEEEWVYGYLLSFGSHLEVVEPKHIRKKVKSLLKESLKKYL